MNAPAPAPTTYGRILALVCATCGKSGRAHHPMPPHASILPGANCEAFTLRDIDARPHA